MVSILCVSCVLIVLLMTLVMVAMRCQGLVAAAGAVNVSNEWRWSAASLDRVSGSDPVWSVLGVMDCW